MPLSLFGAGPVAGETLPGDEVTYLAVIERRTNRPNPSSRCRIADWKSILEVLMMAHSDGLALNWPTLLHTLPDAPSADTARDSIFR